MERKLDRNKYLSPAEVRKLRTYCARWAGYELSKQKEKTGRGMFNNPPTTGSGPRLWMVVDLALSTGLRVAELSAMKVEDLDFGAGAITVYRCKKKKRVADHIPLAPGLATHLRQYLGSRAVGPIVLGQRGPLTRRGWQLAWASACRKSGIRNLSIHKARHTFGTTMYRKTHDLRLVQELLGHSTSVITEQYAHVTFEDMKQAAEGMYEDDATAEQP